MKSQKHFIIEFVLFALLLFATSCATNRPVYSHHTLITEKQALPIDGEWINEGGLSFRIKKGKMYTLNESKSGIPVGSLMAKDIYELSPGRYSWQKETYNVKSGFVDYGGGRIRIVDSQLIYLQALPNPSTGYTHGTPTKLFRVWLDNEEWYLQQLAIIRGKYRDEAKKTASKEAGRKEDVESIGEFLKNSDQNITSAIKLTQYKIGLTTEQQFLSDGWSCEAPFDGDIGLVSMDKNKNINKYVLGFSLVKPNLKGVIKDLVDVCNLAKQKTIINMNMGGHYVQICQIHFSNGIMKNIIWNIKLDEFLTQN